MTTMCSDDDVLCGLDRFEEPLARIPPDCSRDEWIRVGMALHHESNGSNEGLALWRNWSAGGVKYDARELERQWRSFKPTSGGVTGGSIIEMAQQYGYWNGSSTAGASRKSSTAKPGPASEKTRTPWAAVERSLIDEGHCLTAAYGYENDRGTLVAENVRFTPKTFRWRHRCNDECFAGLPEGLKLPPYQPVENVGVSFGLVAG